ncbi:MAG: hypothetical protein NTY02_19410 [Acidobacteria bacterium]|nr:hypothetical protein [Acidobacteriota bacterium]
MSIRTRTLVVLVAMAVFPLHGGAQYKALGGHVAAVSGSSIIIDIGSSHGVQADMVFTVQKAITVVRDPDTGAVRDTVYENIAEIKAVDVRDRSTVCELTRTLNSRYAVAVRDRVVKKT